MRIQHNIMALNSNRQLGVNNSNIAKSLEKLSSGYRINRAGDDAAGLAISEKMRAQIKGLEAATDNSQDAISLIQTAEGGLQEVHSMLNRMTELATKSANGTYTDDVDRKALQDEISALKDEINRIADGTDFNGIKLLDGSMGVGTAGATFTTAVAGGMPAFDVEISGGEGTKVTFTTQAYAAGDAPVSAAWGNDGNLTLTFNGDAADIITQKDIDAALAKVAAPDTAKDLKITLGADITVTTKTTAGGAAGDVTSAKAVKATSVDLSGTGIVLSATKAGKNDSTLTISNNINNPIGATAAANGNVALNLAAGKSYSASEINKMLSDAGADMQVSFDGNKTGAEIFGARSAAAGVADHTLQLGQNGVTGTGLADGGGLTLQIGDTNDIYNQLELSIADMHVDALDLTSVDISKRDGASDAMAKIKAAINTVSTSRGKLGAIQNRLEHTINNLGVTTENITSAESRIRDVDMAKEMMNYTKNSVLVQSAQAMLAQANQQPQSVLQLLQ